MLWARHRATESSTWACLPGADPHKIPIDPNGNLTTKTEGTDTWTYTWNAENQLTKVEKNSVEQARFAYDPLGRRVEKVAGGVTTSYTYDGGAILREVRGSTTLKYVHGFGIDEPMAIDDGSGLSYVHADALGSVVRVTNGAGTVTLTRRYDSWGNLETGAGEPGYAYTGREWEPEIGLYYYRARYYDPKVGRFISEDPLPVAQRRPADVDAYGYVTNNPATWTDPLGLETGGAYRADWCLATGKCGPPPGPKTCQQCSDEQVACYQIAWLVTATTQVLCMTTCTYVLEIGALVCRSVCTPTTVVVRVQWRKKCYEQWLQCMTECKKPKCGGAS